LLMLIFTPLITLIIAAFYYADLDAIEMILLIALRCRLFFSRHAMPSRRYAAMP